MCPAADRALDLEVLQDPYESFIRYHLQHYGYYTDRHSAHCSEPMKVQSWQQESGLQSNQNFPHTDDTEEETQKFNYSFINEHQLLRTRQVVFDYHAGKHIPRLREPHSLYAVATSGPQQAPRWPIECDVIKEQIRHIDWTPPVPERLYQPSLQEHMPVCVGENGRNMVYCIDAASKGSYFTCSRVGGRRGPLHIATIASISKDGNALFFESRFESGNLQKAIRVGPYEYELTLRTDLYTDKHTQWYYFRVQNTRPGVNYRFTIVNLMKSNSLYNHGLKPLLYSEREMQLRQVGWHRTGKDICYCKNSLSQEGRSLYSLTWTCHFPHRNDTCYFAHSYPYTYSDLQRYLATVASDPVQSQYCKLRVLCRSLASNMVHVLTITSPSRSQEAGPAKKAVVVTARVHPGETNGSWVMTGFLDHILGSSDDARLLRDMFIFKVVPMLNPDGVIVGNYRCSLTGRDLNRNYRTVLRDSFPCVWHTRNMVQRLMDEREVVIYCDFHGHSRKNNVFMYGCSNNEQPPLRLWERVFPLMMSRNAANKFSYQSCKFKVQKSKEGTGRIVMWRMGITHSYTMETTFAGSTLGNRRDTHFSTEDLKSLGYHFCDTLLDFCDPDRSKFEQCLGEVRAALHRELRLRLEKLGREYNSDVTMSDLCVSDVESSTSGSDSSVSDGPPAHLMSLAEKSHQKKKRLRTRKERNRLRQRQLLNGPPLPAHLGHKTHLAQGPGEKGTKQIEVRGNSDKTSKGKSMVGKIQLQHTHNMEITPASPWIPQTVTGFSVICDRNAKRKAVWLEAMSTAYLRRGPIATPRPKYDEFAWDNGCSGSRLAPMTSQRRALPMSIVDQQQSPERQQEATPAIKQHPLPFDAELECADTLRRCLSDYSWKRGGLYLTGSPSPTVPNIQRSLSTWSASSTRPLITNSHFSSRSAAPQLGGPKGVRPLEVRSPAADGFTPLLKTEVKPKPDTTAESAGEYLRVGEKTPLAQSNQTQETRKNPAASPDASKSRKTQRGHSSSRFGLQDDSGEGRGPGALLTMATASLVSMDTVLEQTRDVVNIQEGLSKVLPEDHPSLLQSTAANRKRDKVQRLQKLSARAHGPALPKGVSGRTVVIHQASRAPVSERHPSEPTAAGGTAGHRPAPHRKPRETQPRNSETQIQVKQNSLVETLKHQLSTVCLWEEGEQHAARPQNTSTAI